MFNFYDPREIESNMKTILLKLKMFKPKTENVENILGSNNGKLLLCIRKLFEEKKKALTGLSLNISKYI